MTVRRGVTLIEMLWVLAVLAILAAGAIAAFRPGHARRSARAYVRTVQGARLAALAGTPVGVRWDDPDRRFVVREGGDCTGAVRGSLAPMPRVAVQRRLRDGVVWLPDGTGRACSGGGVYGGRVRFADRREAWDVVVASTGRLRIEAGP
jgi:prepilin-type N-terminal cleavage/methylation domain-containing protein